MFFQRVLLAGFVVAIMAQATLGGEFVTPPGKTAPGPRPRVVSDGSGARAMRDMMQEVVLRTIGVGVAVFTCVTCNKQFGRACELGLHYSSPGSSGCVNPNTAGVACVRRKTYTFLQKRDVLFFYDELIREGHFNPVDVLAVRAGVPHSCIHDWIRDRAQIFHLIWLGPIITRENGSSVSGCLNFPRPSSNCTCGLFGAASTSSGASVTSGSKEICWNWFASTTTRKRRRSSRPGTRGAGSGVVAGA